MSRFPLGRAPGGGVVTQRTERGWGTSEVIRYPGQPHGPARYRPLPPPRPIEITDLGPDARDVPARPPKPSKIRPTTRTLIALATEPRKEPPMLATADSAPLSKSQRAYARLETDCYDLATALWGRGAALSIDPEGKGFVARAWTPAGAVGLAGDADQRTKRAALQKLKKRLQERVEDLAARGGGR